MTNKYPAKCYVCSHPVGPGDGVVMRHGHAWRVRHKPCEPSPTEKPYKERE